MTKSDSVTTDDEYRRVYEVEVSGDQNIEYVIDVIDHANASHSVLEMQSAESECLKRKYRIEVTGRGFIKFFRDAMGISDMTLQDAVDGVDDITLIESSNSENNGEIQ